MMALAGGGLEVIASHAPGPDGADAGVTIRPGKEVWVPRPQGGTCTLAFVLDSWTNDTRYALTAGHCVESDGLGEPAYMEDEEGTRLSNWPEIGRAVAFRDDEIRDWGLIRLRTEDANITADPSVLHWTGPTGGLDAGTPQEGDTICYFGQGTEELANPFPRERCGDFSHFDANRWFRFWGPTDPGDSGAPVIDYATGQALGLNVEGLGPYGPPPGNGGDTICPILDDLASRGWSLRLATAAYDPPPPNSYPPDTELPAADPSPLEDPVVGCPGA